MRMFTAFIAVALSTFPAQTHAAEPKFSTKAPVAYVIDLQTHTVLIDKASGQKIAPASMAKMMTAYIVFDLLARGALKETQLMKVRPATWEKWRNTGSSMFLKPNEQVSVANLLKGLLTVSGNDAAVTLAEGIDGNEAAFARRMTKMARSLGMSNSNFATSNGWPDGNRTITTARDLALLADRTIRDFPKLYDTYYGRDQFRWNNVSQNNRDPLLGTFEGADGLKTGHTSAAGYCFAGSAKRRGRRVLMILAGLPTMQARSQESLRTMAWAFDAWRVEELYPAGAIVGTLPVQLGQLLQIPVQSAKPLALSLPRAHKVGYRLVVRYTGPIKAPIKKGAQIAHLVAKFDDGTERTMPLFASESVERARFFGRAFNGLRQLVTQ